MFAVPGWSLSAQLKTQSAEKPQSKPKEESTPTNGDVPVVKQHKKRKRGNGKGVNAENLADVWASVIEGKPKPKKEKERAEKRQKIAEDGEVGEDGEVITKDAEDKTAAAPAEKEKHKKSKSSKDKKREKKAALLEAQDGSTAVVTTKAEPMAKPPSKPAPQLTPLQAAMRQKLISARFRHLNQTLYTTPSAHSLSLFQENPEMFNEYHEGFRKQVEVWPENPVNSYINDIKNRGKIRGPQRGKPEKKSIESSEALLPLPRTEGTCTIADLGCGDAALATILKPLTQKLHLKIHSFDLQSPSPLVTKADIANLPLPDGSADIAIFCLALMGTNWIDFIEEAFRILRWKGELWISEIKSRFGRVAGAKNKRVEHSVGNRKRPLDKKALKQAEEGLNDEVAAVEVDGMEDKGGETDVTAFVEVLRKRGFVLRGEGRPGDEVKSAVDLSNKMFVKMFFVKGCTPIKGKGVPVPQGMEKLGLETWKKKPRGKFIDEEGEGEAHVSSEAGVLKPCVYKLR